MQFSRAVPGVREVRNDDQVCQTFSILPARWRRPRVPRRPRVRLSSLRHQRRRRRPAAAAALGRERPRPMLSPLPPPRPITAATSSAPSRGCAARLAHPHRRLDSAPRPCLRRDLRPCAPAQPGPARWWPAVSRPVQPLAASPHRRRPKSKLLPTRYAVKRKSRGSIGGKGGGGCGCGGVGVGEVGWSGGQGARNAGSAAWVRPCAACSTSRVFYAPTVFLANAAGPARSAHDARRTHARARPLHDSAVVPTCPLAGQGAVTSEPVSERSLRGVGLCSHTPCSIVSVALVIFQGPRRDRRQL